MSKENKTSDKPKNGNDFIADVSGSFSTEDMIKAFNCGSKNVYECEANGKDKKCYCKNDNDCNHRHYIGAEEWLKNYR